MEVKKREAAFVLRHVPSAGNAVITFLNEDLRKVISDQVISLDTADKALYPYLSELISKHYQAAQITDLTAVQELRCIEGFACRYHVSFDFS